MTRVNSRRISRIATGLVALACAAAAAPAGAYTLSSVRIHSRSFVACPNCLAVDRNGDTFVLRSRTATGVDQLRDDIEEFSPSGDRLHRFSTTFHERGRTRWVAGRALAVSADGRSVFVVGTVQAPTDVPAQADPFIGRYSTRSGKLIAHRRFDPNDLAIGSAVALDRSGRHVYAAESGNVTSRPVLASVWEFSATGLSPVKHWPLAEANADPNSLAVLGDHRVVLQIDPGASLNGSYEGASFAEFIAADGTVTDQTSQPGGGIAPGPGTAVLVGAGDEIALDLAIDVPALETFGHGDFHGHAFIGGIDARDDVFALDGTSDSATILKFAPTTPRTTITHHPAKSDTSQNVRFAIHGNLGSNGSLQCRLIQATSSKKPKFSPCLTSTTYRRLTDGYYTFEARTISQEGPVERTPAKFGFSVKLHYPQAVITSHPKATSASSTVKFGFTAGDGDTFLCRLTPIGVSPGPFRECTSPVTYSGLTNRSYVFSVEAVEHGLTQLIGTVYAFTVHATTHQPAPPKLKPPLLTVVPTGDVDPHGGLLIDVAWTASSSVTDPRHLAYALFRRSGNTVATLGPWLRVSSYDGLDGVLDAADIVAPDVVTEYQVQATDPNGTVGTSPASEPIRPAKFDDLGADIAFTGFTTGIETTDAVDGSIAQSDGPSGALATLHFTGREVVVVGATGPALGTLRVCIDPGTPHAGCVNEQEASGTSQQRVILDTIDGLSQGRHTIQVGPANLTPVVLDEFTVL